ncbi:cytochrome P450 [Lentithecium fluviatile CBS 122367]|uniref:Cytochrome P450 n=1 Tax=Lentithecium fluviatile CBS 122367 TaxID=1168545 RepID=A0A6G1IKJ8_9PLEO|nr:cytochrome P450 [Lentithecium fluviatile CBS 122367]
MSKPEAQLPPGSSSTLRGLSETFSFYSSPESFITSRIRDFYKQSPELVASRSVVRAKVLNRNVAVVSSHAQINQILCDDSARYEARGAYEELMAPFYPSPNLLLSDGAQHRQMRDTWERRVDTLPSKATPLIGKLTEEHFESTLSGVETDVYELMKTLSWKILLGVFLDLNHDTPLFAEIESLQEILMRGQFSLLPVSINTGFWSSPRKKGIDARKKLEGLLLDHLGSKESACPFTATDSHELKDIANHTLLSTSSLAVKGLASVLTALFLNLYLYECEGGRPPLAATMSQNDSTESSKRLRSILMETERLSPPIVGIMRRSTSDNVISSLDGEADTLVPKGWDCWLYFAGAGRDPAVVGPTWDRFDPDRYCNDSTSPEGMAFGAGPKMCLGRDLVREMALAVAQTWLRMRLRVEGKVSAKGVRGWLGWEPQDSVSLEETAADMKQLPTQRPSKPVLVRVVRSEN